MNEENKETDGTPGSVLCCVSSLGVVHDFKGDLDRSDQKGCLANVGKREALVTDDLLVFDASTILVPVGSVGFGNEMMLIVLR